MSRREQGAALISAVFLLVVLAALSMYMLSLSGTQHFTAMWAAQGARAHYAAQAGVQHAARQALAGAGCPAPFTVDAGGAAPMQVAVTNCSNSTFQELGVTYTQWNIEVVASAGGSIGSPGYVQRRQQLTIVQ